MLLSLTHTFIHPCLDGGDGAGEFELISYERNFGHQQSLCSDSHRDAVHAVGKSLLLPLYILIQVEASSYLEVISPPKVHDDKRC